MSTLHFAALVSLDRLRYVLRRLDLWLIERRLRIAKETAEHLRVTAVNAAQEAADLETVARQLRREIR